MESTKAEAWPEFGSMDELKASKTEIQSQHAALGVLISTLEARISALESELKDYAGGGENEGFSPKLQDSGSFKKPDDELATTINLTVVGPNGRRKVVRMKRRWILKELMSACCVCWNEELPNVVFLYNRRLLRGDQTPQQLEMEDGDEILAEKRWI